ncbi:MAG: hypothetical protein Unbinned97contig1000_10 [Prokaryotic dsDNA virus sp.]|nr:MAG: hypothetical protein Unbinned97contig1000_10 [Prokaryotic dsDNA virus sp.]|tara:strand:- start:27994 stop:29049 length:1056 start_codon:yes stop_codon:yes gene_type:complete
MAENLGTIDIAVKSDSQQIEQSFDDGSKKAGRNIGDALSGILGSFMGGFGTAAGRAVGAGISVFGMPGRKRTLPGSTPLTVGGNPVGSAGIARIIPILGKIALVAGALTGLTFAIKKVINSIINFGSNMENMSHKFAGINANLAELSARKKISSLLRDMTFAEMIEPVVKSSSDAMGRFKDITNRVSAVFLVVKNVIANNFINIMSIVIEGMLGFAKAFLPVIKIIVNFTTVMGRLLEILFGFISNPIKFISDTVTGKNARLFDLDSLVEEISGTNEALDKIFNVIEEETTANKVQRINDIFSSVGTDLSMGSWTPPSPATQSNNQSNKPIPNNNNNNNRGMGGGFGVGFH